MAFSVTRLRDGFNVEGKWTSQIADVALGTYATGGVSVSPSAVGLKKIYGAQIVGYKDTTSGAYEVKWDYDSTKLMAFRSAGFTPAGTNSKPTFTVEASGAIGANMEVGLSADSAAATFEGGTGITAQRTLTTTSPVGTPTFTGTAVAAAALAEVANGVDLSSVVVRVKFFGLGG